MNRITRRHISVVLSLLLLLVIWLLYGWNSWNGDRDAYEFRYESNTLIVWGQEVGYGYLNTTGKKLGLTYQEFQIFVATITLFLIWRYIAAQGKSPFLLLLMYVICFFSLDYVLMRNSLAFAIILQALLFLFRGDFKGRIIYGVLILLATSIHQSSIIYLPLILIPLTRVYSVWRFACFLVVFYLLFFVGRTFLYTLTVVTDHLDYYTASVTSGIVLCLVHLVSFLLVTMSVIKEKRDIFSIRAENTNDRRLIFIININLLSLVFFILYFESGIFVRLLRTIIFINMCYCVNAIALARNARFYATSHVIIFTVFLYVYFIQPTLNLTVYPLFSKNLIFAMI